MTKDVAPYVTPQLFLRKTIAISQTNPLNGKEVVLKYDFRKVKAPVKNKKRQAF